MGKKSFVVIAVIVSLMVMVGCAKKAVREEPMTTGKAGEQAWGKPGEGTETTGIDEKSLQASLERKKYPGIEGEFLEYMELKYKKTLISLAQGKLSDEITDILEKVAQEIIERFI